MKIELPEIPVNYKEDLHNLEYLNEADLILFMAGNQFMVMEELLEAFQKVYPEVKKIFYETLPPGLELKQILAGGARFGDMEIRVMPDIYTAVSEEAMQELMKRGLIEDYFIYLHNRLVLMVPKDNPTRIKNLKDLTRDDVRISQPGPLEDITRYIVEMYRKAGGEELVHRIMEEKRAEGTTIFTLVHHRETPLRIVKGTVDVGPVWATEVIHAQNQGLPVEMVDLGEELDQRDKVNYYITALTKAPHQENAKKFLDFIRSKEAQKIYAKYGFVPHFPID
ncbi:molybdate ABC transporter substrate-binding protein [Thermodesulfobacterium hydrogeniphilum]|uniref:molybdate ABC transporter substrate-binding protein n=1 Tax=Thermodesulfobacterium hydrogeniphilum TaxID=161156 RepID=UPI000571D192|nr:substrate-binding domain-containing protein [Thermodesulfobacterium hydrogeniphilum]